MKRFELKSSWPFVERVKNELSIQSKDSNGTSTVLNWEANDPNLENNILIRALVNLYVGVLSKYRIQVSGGTRAQQIMNTDLQNVFNTNPSGDPFISYSNWLRIIVSRLLLNGQIWFQNTNNGYLLGTVSTLGVELRDIHDVNFQRISNLLTVQQNPEQVPIQSLGVFSTNFLTGKSEGLLGDPVKEAAKAYHMLLSKLYVKIKHSSEGGIFLGTDLSKLSDATTELSVKDLNDMADNDNTVDTNAKVVTLDPGSTIEEDKSFSFLDKNVSEGLSACLTPVLNALGIPKQVFNVHVSHTGSVHGEVMEQFVDFAVTPMANIITEGLNQYYIRKGRPEIQFSWDIRAVDYQGLLYKSRAAPIKEALTRDEIRETIYRKGPAPKNAVFAGGSSGDSGDEEDDEGRDRSGREREQELSN